MLPFVVAAVRAIHARWYPIGDAAQLYIRATDVLTRDHPWIGSGSSASTSLGFQVNNAGPLYFDLAAPFARTLPPAWGAAIGISAINVACLVLAALAARKIGGAQFGAQFEGWVLAAGSVLAWTMGSQLLFDMFQAHALLFPFLSACVLLVGLAMGQRWVVPWLAFVLTLILQTHLSYAYIVPILLAVAGGAAVAGMGAPRMVALGEIVRSAALRRTAVWTAAVLAVTWSQPVYEQLSGAGEGNLSRLARAARSSDVALGLANAVKVTAAFVVLPPWAGRQGFADTIEPAGVATAADGRRSVVLVDMPPAWLAAAALAMVLAVLGAVWWRAKRRGNHVLCSLALLSAGGVLGSVLALSRLTVTGLGFAPHHTRWLIVVALLVYLTFAWAAVDVLAERTSGLRPTLIALVAVMACSAANLPSYAQPHGPTADEDALPVLRSVFARLDDVRARGQLVGPVYFDLTNERIYAPHTSALQLRLRERGVEFRFDSEFLERQLGARRRADGTEPTTLGLLHEWQAYAAPDACVVIRETGQSPADQASAQARADALVNAVRQALAGRTLTLDLPAGADVVDASMAARVLAGDEAALAEVTLDGRLRFWFEQDWARATDPALAHLLAEHGPGLTEWLRSWFGVTLSGPGACR